MSHIASAQSIGGLADAGVMRVVVAEDVVVESLEELLIYRDA